MLRMIAMWWELRSDLRFRQAEDARSNPGLQSGLSDGKAQFGPPFILDVGVEETYYMDFLTHRPFYKYLFLAK